MKIKNITEQDIEDIIRINKIFMKEYMPENIEGDRKTWEENHKNFWPNTNVLQDYICAENEQGENGKAHHEHPFGHRFELILQLFPFF